MSFLPKLVRLIDGLLEIIDRSPEYVSFMLDGQTIALEDYLTIRPSNRERLASAVQSGKIVIGPWYILPDELLISGESHIRNFLTGQETASAFGGASRLGYLPDSFGHPAQMPQILLGLGMDTALFWRGASHDMAHTEFYWLAPDGKSRVFCVHMPHGYGSMAALGGPAADTVRRLVDMMDSLGGKSKAGVVLLMNGSDHILAERDIPEVVAAFNGQGSDKRIQFSTLQDFLADLNAHLPETLETYAGPLCSGDRAVLLGGTLSTRMYLKQRNFAVQAAMERVLEPLVCHERLIGGRFDFAGYQRRLWRLILENHPHDSICGCSLDEVHDEMLTRFDVLEQLQDQLLEDTAERLQGREPPANDAECLLFEPTQDGLPSYAEITVDFDLALRQSVDFAASAIIEDNKPLPPPPAAVEAEDETGRRFSARILSAEPCDFVPRYSDFDLPRIYRANRVRLGLLLPGFSYGAHTLRFTKRAAAPPAPPAPADRIENEFYIVSFDPATAGFAVTDRKTGRVHTDAHRFVNMGDAGDEYTYSWPDEDRVVALSPSDPFEVTVSSGLVQTMRVSGVLRLPRGLSPDRKTRAEETVDCPFAVTVTLTPGVDRVDFDTRFDNAAHDHRLQVEFPAGVLCTHSAGSSAFAVTPHLIEQPVPQTWEEYPQSAQVTHGFADAGDGRYGVSLAARGLTEYEAVNRDGQTRLRLTLLRCVGWLSRDDLNTRHGNGGWSFETPGAQCLGTHSFSYSATWREGSWQTAGTYALADRRLHPAYIRQTVRAAAPAGNPLAFLSRLPGLVRLSAVKPAEAGNGVVLRLFNVADAPQEVCLPLPAGVGPVWRVSLDERRLTPMDTSDGALRFSIEPHEIMTFELT